MWTRKGGRERRGGTERRGRSRNGGIVGVWKPQNIKLTETIVKLIKWWIKCMLSKCQSP